MADTEALALQIITMMCSAVTTGAAAFGVFQYRKHTQQKNKSASDDAKISCDEFTFRAADGTTTTFKNLKIHISERDAIVSSTTDQAASVVSIKPTSASSAQAVNSTTATKTVVEHHKTKGGNQVTTEERTEERVFTTAGSTEFSDSSPHHQGNGTRPADTHMVSGLRDAAFTFAQQLLSVMQPRASRAGLDSQNQTLIEVVSLPEHANNNMNPANLSNETTEHRVFIMGNPPFPEDNGTGGAAH
ncbi:MAG: hypothetical protein V4485_05535 [Pseudomonadota bacterium]